ncbi:prepilin-type N-terminal cleavage/methylation domain-containing protein [Shewanella eurypsychrophilus]|uniref:Prepilin-type N-terminal cleavage/methylation domain-containing protein n=1 Tax=Shewanella eurypsychrophilus TaxID=2593656 RepID=A0ABX6V8L3_9GAMM|nr:MULTISPECIES: prepilin-type N-terminal cleavage/methylation domain-containing protein [Shewanella]QFU23646.1 prepilin-type N-terminal cleavage/methylation domain-containing protein [Shewanella sp. YLB-09]QPG58868.1 prepilin-type N-terminal cleavage/methylation domain-containing protein [Shewanella eurypsychrophilus]
MRLHKHKNGFTLIELVVVIIILGILAVIAAPKFLSLGSDAQTATLKGVTGSITSMNQLVHSKTQVDGIADKPDCSYDCNGHPNWDRLIGHYFIDVSGTRLYVYEGYPLEYAGDPIVERNYRTVMDLPADEYIFVKAATFSIVPIKFADKLPEIEDGSFKCHIEGSASLSDHSFKAVTNNC